MVCTTYLAQNFRRLPNCLPIVYTTYSTHLNSMLRLVLRVSARNSWLLGAGQHPSEIYVACCVVGICKKLLLVCSIVAGQHPFDFYVACCVAGICKETADSL